MFLAFNIDRDITGCSKSCDCPVTSRLFMRIEIGSCDDHIQYREYFPRGAETTFLPITLRFTALTTTFP